MAEQVDRRPGRDDDDLRGRQHVGRVRDHELVADRADDDPGDEHDVEVRVAVAREQRPVRRDLEAALRDRGDVVEVQPPHRRRREERERERGRPVAASSSRSAVVAPVITIDSPSAMMMKSWKRSAKCDVSTSHVSLVRRGRPGTQ